MPTTDTLPLVWQKRLFDVGLSSVLLVLTSPLFLLFFGLIIVEHTLRGRPFDPLLYSELRVSRGKLFRLNKFNIFDQHVVNELRLNGTFIHSKHLERNGQLLLVGKFLKQIYLDELPQLLAVWKGDMSLVGPRPVNREVFASMCTRGVPAIARIQGGMSGNYQSHKNTRGASAEQLEAYYLQQYMHRSGWGMLRLDIKILLRTCKVLLRAKGV